MKQVSANTVPASAAAGNPPALAHDITGFRVAAEIADLTAEATALLGRAPTAGDLMVLNVKRNGARMGLSNLRKAVDNALILRQNAEIDARLDTLHSSDERRAFFHTIYPLTLTQRLREEQRQRIAERMAKGRDL